MCVSRPRQGAVGGCEEVAGWGTAFGAGGGCGECGVLGPGEEGGGMCFSFLVPRAWLLFLAALGLSGGRGLGRYGS